MADETLLEETAPEASETQVEEEVDYKAMYESEKANAEKWKAMSRKNEEAYKKAAAKGDADGEARVKELEERALKAETEAEELRLKNIRSEMVAQIAARNDVDQRIISVLAGETEEELEAALGVIKSAFGTAPVIRDGGVPSTPQKTNQKVFSDFMNTAFNN